MKRLAVALLLLCAAAAQAQAQAEPAAACRPDPLAGRTLYLRGTFNSWNALETQKLSWACNRWQGVARIEGEHRFKLDRKSTRLNSSHSTLSRMPSSA